MRICHVICNLYAGGAQTFVVALAVEQKKIGNDVSVVIIDKYNNSVFETFLIDQVRNNNINVYTLDRTPGINVSIIKCFYLFAKYLKVIKPDIINSHLQFSHLFLGIYKKGFNINMGKSKVILTIHSAPEPWNRQTLLTNKTTPTIYCSNTSLTTSVSRDCQKVVITNGIKLPVVNDSADKILADYNIDKGHKLILMVGQLTHQKNYPLAAEIASLYQSKNVSFLICGIREGTSERDLALFEPLKNIHYLGVKLPAEIHSLMNKCDCFLSTSIIEGLPITILEAFFIGQPCVLSPIPSLVDIGTTMPFCYIASDMTAKPFAEEIDKALKIPLTKAEIKAERATELAKYQIDKVALKYHDFYKTVIDSQ